MLAVCKTVLLSCWLEPEVLDDLEARLAEAADILNCPRAAGGAAAGAATPSALS